MKLSEKLMKFIIPFSSKNKRSFEKLRDFLLKENFYFVLD